MDGDINEFKKRLRAAERVAVLTGAGISAESGIPTFRGDEGLWKNHRAMELATPEAFARDPELVWEFYKWRREVIGKAGYNRAHKALVEMENRIPQFALITQNVDGLHSLAGSGNVLEIHGNIWKSRCTGCGLITLNYDEDMGRIPRCSECGEILRPDVVWFGESLDPSILSKAMDVCRKCEIMMVIGTSSIVQPASSLAFMAKEANAVVAEINIERTAQSDTMDFVLTGKSGEIVPDLLEGWE
ncbi:MAG: NAD-dependent deacylase [Deltaproteobacteria bacterium]|nr:NAD-dependent deacylase [Deltaproteobacteria bacterium]